MLVQVTIKSPIPDNPANVSGLPPQQFLIQCRLQQAAALLVGTGEPVGVIAERVGIGNEFYFSRLLKAK